MNPRGLLFAALAAGLLAIGVFAAAASVWVVAVAGVVLVLSTQTARAIFVEQPGPFPREGECNVADPYFDAVRHRIGVDHRLVSRDELFVIEPSLAHAAAAFAANEALQAHLMRNTPTDYEKRKQAFIDLKLAQEAANRANCVLYDRITPRSHGD